MLKVNLSFAKIVATPTPISWSQAYNAGNFFVVLSLTNHEEENETTLTTLGKQIINNLEAEFFGLETKSLETIKEALSVSVKDIPNEVVTSLALSFIKDSILYVFIYGTGSIVMKRGGVTATLLSCAEMDNNITSASGFIKQNDVIVIQTKQFADLINNTELNSALELTLPNDIAETLSPHVHNSDNGGASAVIISITGVPAHITEMPTEPYATDPEIEDESQDYNILSPKSENLQPKNNNLKIGSLFTSTLALIPVSKMRSRNFILLILALFIVIALAYGVFMNLQKRKNEEMQKSFTLVYSQAEEKYQEAMGIKSLNPKLSTEILNDADSVISKNIKLFPENSGESKKLSELQEKIRKVTSEPIQGKDIKAEEVDKKESLLLQAIIENKDTNFAAEDENFIYIITDSAISSVDKDTNTKKRLIENDNDWKQPASIGTFLGNLYVLDKTNGLIKFVVAQNGYGKTDYFTVSKPDLSKAVSMSIDGSVWILSADGKINKYTKGTSDQFELKGLDGLNNPSQIYTTEDIQNIYVLDKGNSRIVQIAKDGTVKNSFRSNIFSKLSAFTVSGDEKTIYVLSDNKVYKLSL